MAQSKVQLAKNKKKAEEKAGITAADKDPRVAKKAAAAKNTTNCTNCGQEIKVTGKMIEAKQHHEAKHPKLTYAECFPGMP